MGVRIPSPRPIFVMSKVEKKKRKLSEEITRLETELQTSLGKKDSRTPEINVPGQLRKIADLKAELVKLGG